MVEDATIAAAGGVTTTIRGRRAIRDKSSARGARATKSQGKAPGTIATENPGTIAAVIIDGKEADRRSREVGEERKNMEGMQKETAGEINKGREGTAYCFRRWRGSRGSDCRMGKAMKGS